MSEKSKTILIADDEPDVRSYLCTLLRDNGYIVLEATNGREAYDIATSKHPDLVSLDISMPEESGTRAFRDIQDNESTKDIPVIIVTGIDSRYKKFIHTRKQVAPPAGYFEKPINREEFLGKVKEILKN